MTALLRTHFARATALIALMTSACDETASVDAADDIGVRDGSGQSGPKFNTNVILASAVPQVDTRGGELDGVSLVSVRVAMDGAYWPVEPNSLHVENGALYGTANGQPLVATGFIGSRWKFRVDEVFVEATLTVVESGDEAGLYDPNDPQNLRMLDPQRPVYTFMYNSGLARIATCAPDSIAGARMVLYGDLYVDHLTGQITDRSDTIYFGCFSGAVGKSALWGYAPDNPTEQSIELDAFETAVRAVRSDYCADGHSYTEVGNQVTLLDEFGINDHGVFNFTTEAVWEAGGGAQCVSRIRVTGETLISPFECPGGKTIPLCTEQDVDIEKAILQGFAAFWTKIP